MMVSYKEFRKTVRMYNLFVVLRLIGSLTMGVGFLVFMALVFNSDYESDFGVRLYDDSYYFRHFLIGLAVMLFGGALHYFSALGVELNGAWLKRYTYKERV